MRVSWNAVRTPSSEKTGAIDYPLPATQPQFAYACFRRRRRAASATQPNAQSESVVGSGTVVEALVMRDTSSMPWEKKP